MRRAGLLILGAVGLPLLQAGCGSSPVGEFVVEAPEATAGGVRLIRGSMGISINDYQGKYRLFGDVRTSFEVPEASFLGEAWAATGYSSVQEVVEIRRLVLEPTGETEAESRLPIFDYAQENWLPSLECTLWGEGRAVPYVISLFEDEAQYTFDGSVSTDCLGDVVALETGVYYDDPGELTGSASGGFTFERVDAASAAE